MISTEKNTFGVITSGGITFGVALTFEGQIHPKKLITDGEEDGPKGCTVSRENSCLLLFSQEMKCFQANEKLNQKYEK